MRKFFVAAFLFCSVLIMSSNTLFADENRARMTDTELLSRKIDKIAESQTQIIKALEELKAELEIVKIRVTAK
jgi:hypothetical protein